jgi:hypothetical protein
VQSRRAAVEQVAQLLEPRHSRDVALDRWAAWYAISNPFVKTAAPTHRLLVKLENARRTAAIRANEKWPFAAVRKAAVDNLDLAPQPVVALAENDLDQPRLLVTTPEARSRETLTDGKSSWNNLCPDIEVIEITIACAGRHFMATTRVMPQDAAPCWTTGLSCSLSRNAELLADLLG